jgi:hypothetical protein
LQHVCAVCLKLLILLSCSLLFNKNSWSGLLEIVNYEAHDIRLAIEVVSEGFWMDNAFIVCRTGADLGLPSSNAYSLEGSAFYWYDVDQEVIITNTTFRNCGYRSTAFAQYDTSPTRGCGNTSDVRKGCADYSTVIGFLSDADQFAPQVMQATNGISFENCGRRFRFSSNSLDTVSGRGQNWIDIDGTASGFWEPAIIASGLNSVKNWWGADKNCKTLVLFVLQYAICDWSYLSSNANHTFDLYLCFS